MTSPLRVDLEIDGVGVIELHPFAVSAFSRGEWPDGTLHREQRRLTHARWTVQRAPRGWTVTHTGRDALLVQDEVVQVEGLALRLRARDAPLLDPRLRVSCDGPAGPGVVDLIDTRWPLSIHAPRRIGVHAGALVELLGAEHGRAMRDEAPRLLVPRANGAPWLGYPAPFAVPLAHFLAAGGEGPDPPVDARRFVVTIDGALREVPISGNELLAGSYARDGAGERPVTRGAFPGAVAGLFPELAAEWRALEEQAAMLAPT